MPLQNSISPRQISDILISYNLRIEIFPVCNGKLIEEPASKFASLERTDGGSRNVAVHSYI